jgi:hypothetical protein
MTRLGLVVLLLASLLGPDAAAQDAAVSDSVRAAARRDFHGADGRGKDGPLVKAGLDLLTLYHAYRAHQDTASANAPFEVPGPTRVTDGRVTVDAIAADDPEALRADLERLGARRLAVARRLVSAQLPIAAIPEAARLPSLQGMRPAMGVTQGTPRRRPTAPRDALTADAAPPDTSASDASAPDAAAEAEDDEGDGLGEGGVRIVAIGASVVVAVVLTALFLRNL